MLPVQSKITIEVRAAGFACTRLLALTTPPLGTLKKEEADLWHHNLSEEWVIKLPKPSPQRVQVTDKKTGRPLAAFEVTARPTPETRGGNAPHAWGQTDANGYALLWLPPGK